MSTPHPGPKVPRVDRLEAREIEAISANLVRAISPDTLGALRPFPVEEFCELGRLGRETGFELVVDNLGGFYAARMDVDEREIVIDASIYQDLGGRDHRYRRARYTLAHEVAHAYLHSDQMRVLNSQPRHTIQLFWPHEIRPLEANPEWQADQFAAGLLMPIDAVQALWQEEHRAHGQALIIAMVSRLGVTDGAARHRVANLERAGCLPRR